MTTTSRGFTGIGVPAIVTWSVGRSDDLTGVAGGQSVDEHEPLHREHRSLGAADAGVLFDEGIAHRLACGYVVHVHSLRRTRERPGLRIWRVTDVRVNTTWTPR